ncbi:hypothetical protein Tco_1485372 [Tanacetum coccineum]
MKVKESLNVTFNESPPPTKLSPLVDDDVGDEEAIRNNTKVVNNNNEEDESIEVDEVVNIKESKNYPLDQVIGNLIQRTLRSQAQDHSNFFCFISSIEPKDVNEYDGGVELLLGSSNKTTENKILFDQSKYIKEMLKKFRLENSKLTKTPMSTEIKLTMDDEADSVDSSKYRVMIGSLLYLTASRPDNMFSVCICACFQENPKTTHIEDVEHIFRHKQTTLAISTTEAEYIFARKACPQALWMKQAFIDCDIRLDEVPITCDNKGAIDLNQLIRRIHQLDTTYRPFYSEQHIDLCSLNIISVLPNNTAYSVKSIRRTDLQQTHTAYSDQLNSIDERITMAERNDYISVTRKNFISNDNEGRMMEIFLSRYKECTVGEWFKKERIGSVTTWEDLVEKFVQKFYQLSNDNEVMEAEEGDDPDDIADIFKIEGNLFDYETPLCKAFNDFNYLLKINTDLFTFNIQGISSYIDEFCNGGELLGMVRVGSMTYFQDHKWYDEFSDEKLKEETLMHKAKVEESWGNPTPGVMKFCAWLINSFENFHKLDYNVLVKLQECWWNINAHEVTPFTRSESYGQRPYANFKTEKAYDPYLDINRIFGRNYDTSNAESEYLNHLKDNLDGYRELLRIIEEGWLLATPDDE